MKNLVGKVALVTGASKGLGASISKALAAAGASVIVNYAGSKSAAELVVSEIVQSGGNAIAVQGDISQEDHAKRLVDSAVQSFGSIDILVNNAGVYEYGSLEDITEAGMRKIFEIDVMGLLFVAKAAVSCMQNGGSIINIGSVASRFNQPGTLVYTAAKHAVDGITLVLSKELASKDIRVNSINPGLIETEGTRTAGFFDSGSDEGYASTASLGVAGKPEDIAAITAFLAGPESRWISGEIIVANGMQVA